MRTFKTKRFAKDAKKAGISEADLGNAIVEIAKGQCDDLGGGVVKKRLSKNDYRSIVLTRSGDYWVFAYLFAKADRANIKPNELEAFRLIAGQYVGYDDNAIEKLLKSGALVEIFNA